MATMCLYLARLVPYMSGTGTSADDFHSLFDYVLCNGCVGLCQGLYLAARLPQPIGGCHLYTFGRDG